MKVLIVDQDLLVRRHCEPLLEEAGYACEQVENAAGALRLLAVRGFDLVIAHAGVADLADFDLPLAPGGASSLLIFPPPHRPGAGQSGLRFCLELGLPARADELHQAISCVRSIGGTRPGAFPLDEAAILAHEFRSPLAGIRMAAEALGKGYHGPLARAQREAVERIERNCDCLENTMACLGDLYELEGRPADVPTRAVDLLAEVLAPVLARPEYREPGKGMCFSLDASGPVLASGDPRLLSIVVTNLLNNAIKYGHAGSEVRIRVGREAGQAMVSVRNEGIGIPPEYKGRLFRRFGRLRQGGTEGVRGAGLGLYLCRRIIGLFGGSIEVRSEPGQYAEFLVFLKLA